MASFSFCVSDEVSCPWRVHQPVCPPGNSFPLGGRFPPRGSDWIRVTVGQLARRHDHTTKHKTKHTTKHTTGHTRLNESWRPTRLCVCNKFSGEERSSRQSQKVSWDNKQIQCVSVLSCRRYAVTGSIPTSFLFERLAATKVKNLKKN